MARVALVCTNEHMTIVRGHTRFLLRWCRKEFRWITAGRPFLDERMPQKAATHRGIVGMVGGKKRRPHVVWHPARRRPARTVRMPRSVDRRLFDREVISTGRRRNPTHVTPTQDLINEPRPRAAYSMHAVYRRRTWFRKSNRDTVSPPSIRADTSDAGHSRHRGRVSRHLAEKFTIIVSPVMSSRVRPTDMVAEDDPADKPNRGIFSWRGT